MLRILVVDDELVVRVGIKSMIDWGSHGFEVVGEASDGEEALAKVRQLMPDIVITDIKMPVMDGIRLISKLREQYGHIRILVLSCHNDFDYVKQAMKLGAADYILKLSMRREELLEVMEGIKGQIVENREKTKVENSLQRKINSNMDAIREKFFKKALNGNYISPCKLYAEAGDLGLRFFEGKHALVGIKLDKEDADQKKARLEPGLLRDAILNIIEETIPCQLPGEAFAESNESFAVIFSFDAALEDFRQVSEQIGGFAQRIRDSLQLYLNVCVSIGIHDSLLTGVEELHKGYTKAAEAAAHSFYYNDGAIIPSSRVIYSMTLQDYFDSGLQKRIYAGLDAGDIDGVSDCIGEMFIRIGTDKRLSPGDAKRIGRMLMAALCQAVRTHDITDKEGRTPVFDLRDDQIQRTGRLNTLIKLIDECLIEYSCLYHKGMKGIYSEEIRKLLLHINENLDGEITLEQAAGFLNLGKNYFCSVFKKETGQTFNNYLINIRMEKAKELLKTTALRNYEIALKVGYDNFNYFSTVFKRVTGMYPNKFRKN